MASDQRHLDDSAGDQPILPLCNRKKPETKVQELELKPLAFSVARDSGCYTGSPMAANSIQSDKFTFEGKGEDESLGPSASTNLWSQSSTCALPKTANESTMDDDEDDDVFQESADSFIDSGLQSMSVLGEDGSYRHSHLRLPPFFHLYKQQEREDQTESDDDSSTTSGEFSTAEMNIDVDMKGAVSKPIDIPARSNNSSPAAEEDELDAVRIRPHPELHSTPRLLERRATVGQFNNLGIHENVSDADDGNRVDGACGPLPDVVPHGIIRPRAMSESAIPSQYHLVKVGSKLQKISDEFSDTTIIKHRSLIQVRQRNSDRIRQGNSYPEAGRRNSGFFARLFSSSHE
ncbi:uncharacterized protein [Watersipora subatra]|uniref:uncharacterized protein n=1 Tax=Watersipora subatra TaxID=2589382 RepID=UPI00355B1C1B